ncbi:ribosomal protein S5 alanine N-acetyltransferase [Asanoa ishikariensis]|uniref:[SSU ribosomal protein S5P]-alanine acetyltransferase n=1 Tax=Asanoa ishikariensis TaxID=137265 RepID=A0A1H3S2G3_9ACTN|nr:GNAT family protein [Asanoa ishikariensis]GIF66593.1 ribosomal protein S5 alanine N-acetyltransferase [Asanoa ishikariensis]SDZ31808.1 [SSU ribosomal protein S5P]-alanine acetyltransferase [Asanoa ishikariensis]
MVQIRPVDPADADVFTTLAIANREFLAPFEPDRAESFYTPAGQLSRIESALADPHVHRCAIEADGEVVGMISLSVIEYGPAQSANLGYWVAEAANGRGIASKATALMVELAFGAFGLHRVQAGTRLDNVASQKVLARNGFERIGVARSYLRVAGDWHDHVLFQRINDEWKPA